MKIDSKEIKKYVLDKYKKCQSDMDYLSQRRQKAARYYRGEVDFKADEGRSQQVTNDVSDTIEWTMPFLMRTFYGSDKIMTLKPTGPEDDYNVRLLEAKCTHDITKKNEGFRIHYDWFKDALVFDLGVLKYGWKNEVKYIHKEYNGLTDMDIQLLQSTPDFIFEHVEAIQAGQYNELGYMLSPTLYRVIGKKVKKISQPFFENVPPDEYLFDIRMRNIKEFGGINIHRKLIHVDELKKYGLNKQDMASEVRAFSQNTLYQERFGDIGGTGFLTPDEDDDYFYINESYFWKYDEEYGQVPLKATIVGDKVLSIEQNKYGRPPFCVLSPILAPHRMLGLSFMNVIMNTQDVRTSFLRNILDNIYHANYGRMVYNPYRIFAEDVEDNRVGRNIRLRHDGDPRAAFANLEPTMLPKEVYHMFEEYLPEARTDATGVTKHDQELQSKTVYKTASGVSQVMGAMQQRKELLARIFAETGVKDFYMACARMNVNFLDKEEAVELDGRWINIKPDDIDIEYDVEIDVGMSTGSKEIAFQDILAMFNTYGMIAKQLGPATFQLFSLENIKEMIRELWRNKGFKNTSRFVNENPPNPLQTPMMPMGNTQMPQRPPNYQGTFRGDQPSIAQAPAGIPGTEAA